MSLIQETDTIEKVESLNHDNDSQKQESLSDYYFTRDDKNEELDLDITIKTIDINNIPSVIDRFFQRYYFKKPNDLSRNEDHQILIHSNRICLIGLAARHEALQKTIVSINFNIGNVDRSQNKVKGKGKKGAMILQPKSRLAIVSCDDGSEYNVLSCITGKLIEINQCMITNPGLLKSNDEGSAYIAVVLPRPEHCELIKGGLLTQEQYLN